MIRDSGASHTFGVVGTGHGVFKIVDSDLSACETKQKGKKGKGKALSRRHARHCSVVSPPVLSVGWMISL